MASSMTTHKVFIPNDVIPTAQTKIQLAENILVSPLGIQIINKHGDDESENLYCDILFQFWVLGHGVIENSGVGMKNSMEKLRKHLICRLTKALILLIRQKFMVMVKGKTILN